MAVAVADAAAVDDHRVVQERVLALANGLELAQEVRELLDVEAVDLLKLLVLSGVAAVSALAIRCSISRTEVR